MAFTYTLTTDLGKVRLLIPDNDSTAYDLEDDEIEYFLTARGDNVTAAASDCCALLARQFAKLSSFSADGLSVQYGQRAQNYAAQATALAAKSQGGMSTVSITREDGYSETAVDSEYQSRTVYIKL